MSVFGDHYKSVKLNNLTLVRVDKFIKDCCGSVLIEETNETTEKSKHIVIVSDEKVEPARTKIGKMFQEFQKSGGRTAAMACLTSYQNFPLVNDNISGHAQRLSEKIRDRYWNCPKTTYQQSSSPSYSYHGNTATTHEQTEATSTPVPRSIIRTTQNNTTQQQSPQSPQAQQHQKTTTNQVE
jgi:hypothetical protein